MKTKLSILLSFIIALIIVFSSKSCIKDCGMHISCGSSKDSIRLYNQSLVDSFQSSLPGGCNCFLGKVQIIGADITDRKSVV